MQNNSTNQIFEFTIRSLFFFDPTLKPKKEKPREDDIQDAKLLYYYPKTSLIHEKRNHVGLGEGDYQFWEQINKSAAEIQKEISMPLQQKQEEIENPVSNEEIKHGRVSELQSIQKNLNAQIAQDLPEVKEDIIQDQQFMEKHEVKYIRKDAKAKKEDVEDYFQLHKAKSTNTHQSQILEFDNNKTSEDVHNPGLLLEPLRETIEELKFPSDLKEEIDLQNIKFDNNNQIETKQIQQGAENNITDQEKIEVEKKNLADQKLQIQQEVKLQTTEQIITENNNSSTNKIDKEVTNNINTQITNDASDQTSKDISNEISKDISNQISKDISNEISKDITNEISKDIGNEISKDISNQISKNINNNQNISKANDESINPTNKNESTSVSIENSNNKNIVPSKDIDNTIPNQSTQELGKSITPRTSLMKQLSLNENKEEVIFLNNYIHIIKQVEENLWMVIVIQKEQNADQLYTVQKDEYYSSEQGQYLQLYIKDDEMLNFSNHFYKTLILFYGYVRNRINLLGQENFQIFMDDFITRFIHHNTYQINNFRPVFNVLNFEFRGVKYPLIEKAQFLALQFLLNLLSSVNNNIKHFIIFLDGYFIYSTFPHNIAYQFYNYYYSCGNPFFIDEGKITKKFFSLQNNADVQPNSYGTFYNSFNLSLILQQSKSKPEVMEKQLAMMNEQQYQMQKVFIQEENKEYKLSTYLQNKLLILSFFDQNAQIFQQPMHEINLIISKYTSSIVLTLQSMQEKIKNPKDTYRYMYFNNMNFSFKVSSQFDQQNLNMETLSYIKDTYSYLVLKQKAKEKLIKTPNAWIYGVKSLDRIIIMLFPSILTLPKLQEEKEKLIQLYFSNMYI